MLVWVRVGGGEDVDIGVEGGVGAEGRGDGRRGLCRGK